VRGRKREDKGAGRVKVRALKMNKGSRTALSPVSTRAILRGVTVSPRPRKMPLHTSQSVSAGAPKALTRR